MADITATFWDKIAGRIARTFVDQGDGTYAQRLSASSLGAAATDIIGVVDDRGVGEIPVLYVKQPDGTYALKVVVADLPTGGVTDHGALTGLADDDHPQYTTDAEATVIADAEAAAAVATHAGALDPHATYTTSAAGGAGIGGLIIVDEYA